MGILGVVFPFMIGTTIGAIAGYAGGWVDSVLMRVVDVVLAFPFLVLMLAIITILQPGLVSFYIAIALVGCYSRRSRHGRERAQRLRDKKSRRRSASARRSTVPRPALASAT